MRNLFPATAAVLFALIATPIVPASAGSYGHHGHYYDDDDDYAYRAPPLVVYKSYLPDEDAFGPIPRHYVFRHYYREPSYRYYSGYRHSYYSGYRHGSGDGCGWLKRRAKHTDSRYWWKRYHDCVD